MRVDSPGGDLRPVPNPHGPSVGDYPWEELPREAWFDRGQRSGTLWVLELRADAVPLGFDDIIRAKADGTTGFRFFLTTAQRAAWERRWANLADQRSRELAELHAEQEARAVAERTARRIERYEPENSPDAVTINDVKTAIDSLYVLGDVSERTGVPKRCRVAKLLEVSVSTLARVTSKAKYRWPRRRDLESRYEL